MAGARRHFAEGALSELNAKLDQARQRMPLRRLMAGRGRGPANDDWKRFPACPYCHGRDSASVFAGPQGDWFKCHRTSCPSGTSADHAAWDAIGFLAFELKCDRPAALRAWLKEAGLEEPQPEGGKAPSSDCTAVAESPLEEFVARASLSDADRQELKTKRGLSDAAIGAAHFLTNDRSNFSILQALALHYRPWQLAKCGLYKLTDEGGRPCGQYYGFGVVGKKKRLSPELLETGEFDGLDEDDFAWAHKESGQCNPILIPYYDLAGKLAALRPHKGFPKGQKPRLYLAGGRQALKQCERAVITEGELKAAALQDVVGAEWAVASVPGITQVKNMHVWADLLDWLNQIGAQTVVVVFDREEQGDPRLPGYRPQLPDRFEAEVWARVCAVRLEREGYVAQVGHLPIEWQDAQGKADWDSVLAAFRQQGKTGAEIRAQFLEILQAAIPVQHLKRASPFAAEAEQAIADRVAVRTYEPALPWGSAVEQKIARELFGLAKGKLRDWAGAVVELAQAYEKTLDGYYDFYQTEQRREKLYAQLSAAKSAEEIYYLKLALKGSPKPVAQFRLYPYYVLLKLDGGRDRLVKLVNTRGEGSGLVPLDEKSMTAPRDFRVWLAGKGNYGWDGGEKNLQALQRDLNFKLARREVSQLACYGCVCPGQGWFLEDCAYFDDGTVVVPDGAGIFWHRQSGHIFKRDSQKIPMGEEDQSFRLKRAPGMQPGKALVFAPNGALDLADGGQDDPEALQELLSKFAAQLNASFQGPEGLMLVAATLAYFAAPEIYARRGEFPGVWISGEKGSGKTCTAKWLMALHGFSDLESGLSFKTSSAVGIQIALGQYANVPVWGDEYKETELKDESLKGVIHAGFNREIPSKWSAEGRPRTIRTNLLMTGETTCANAATMSRFVSTVAAKERRQGSGSAQLQRVNWLQDHRPFYFTIGRAVLRQRTAFARNVLVELARWEQREDLAQAEPRTQFAYGVAYAAAVALNEIIPFLDGALRDEFQAWLVEKAKASTREVAERVTLNQFFRDVLSMANQGYFGDSRAGLEKYFKLVHNPNPPEFTPYQCAVAEEHARWGLEVPVLAFIPSRVIPLVKEFRRKQGEKLELDQTDIRAQMQVHPYFVPSPNRQGHQYKFGRGVRNNSYCWLIDLAKFEEMGIRRVSDEEWEISRHRDGDVQKGLLPDEEWIDPRAGELFLLVNKLRNELMKVNQKNIFKGTTQLLQPATISSTGNTMLHKGTYIAEDGGLND